MRAPFSFRLYPSIVPVMQKLALFLPVALGIMRYMSGSGGNVSAAMESRRESAFALNAEPVWHGGDIAEAQRMFPQARAPWIDLSTGINPEPYPLGQLPADIFQRLPSPAQQAELEMIAARAYGAISPAHVAAAPGTQALLELLPRLRVPGRVAVLGPTYAEHAICWQKAGHEVFEVADLDAASGADTVVVVNPNNPDGRRFSSISLQHLAAKLVRRGGLLVVDEAFADFENENSLIPNLPESTVVLRSFGKAYGLAGVRLGFIITEPWRAARVRERLGPWAVSGPALAAGQKALADTHWLRAARQARAQDADRLDALLRPVLGAPVGGTFLFRTFRTPDAGQIFARLGQAGIFVRRFSHDSSLLRIGLPGDEAQWIRLGEALQGGA